jgi:hypothetical protein
MKQDATACRRMARGDGRKHSVALYFGQFDVRPHLAGPDDVMYNIIEHNGTIQFAPFEYVEPLFSREHIAHRWGTLS